MHDPVLILIVGVVAAVGTAIIAVVADWFTNA